MAPRAEAPSVPDKLELWKAEVRKPEVTEAPRYERLLKYGALVVLVVQNSALALVMRYSRTVSDTPYITRWAFRRVSNPSGKLTHHLTSCVLYAVVQQHGRGHVRDAETVYRPDPRGLRGG